jgi:NADH dehydrogenase FAD-containing subunit
MHYDEAAPKDYYTRQNLAAILTELNIEIQWSTALKEITDGGAIVEKDNERKTIKADTILLAMGVKPRADVAESLRHCAPETEVFVVGDAKQVGGNISFAVNGAFQAALHI